MTRSPAMITAAIALILAASGCSRSPRVEFYVMEPAARVETPTAPPAVSGAAAEEAAVVVGPVTLPELVDRPQLVVRPDANRVDILEAQRWAEPLKTAIPRLVAQNLGRQLGSNRISSYHEVAGGHAEYRVLLDLLRFDSVPGDSVVIEANWSIRGAEGPARTGRSTVREKIAGTGYQAIVAAYSRGLGLVSADIAAAIREVQLRRH
jgi:uncharacterized protein